MKKYIIKEVVDESKEVGYLIYKRKFWVLKYPIKISTLGTYGIPFFLNRKEAEQFIKDNLQCQSN